MHASPRPDHDLAETETAGEDDATVKAAAAFLNQLARTLKTCRLYDAANPTVVRFRADLSIAARRMLAEHPAVTYAFRSDDVLCGDVSLYPARSRDDNLALAFYRDGIRSLTLRAGVDAREMEAVLDAVLHVTGQNPSDDDLVTLLWEAQLEHVDVDYVPGEGDMGSSSSAAAADTGAIMPWPTWGGEETAATTDESQSAAGDHSAATSGRSDDWSVGEQTAEIEAGFAELESLAPSEVERFQSEYEAEHGVPIVTASIAIAYAYLAAGARDDDRADLGRFLPRVLRQAVTRGHWLEAREAMSLLGQCGNVDWSRGTFEQELLQPISISSAVERLDSQETEQFLDFIAFARTLGDTAVDWLNLVLAESQNRRNRRLLAQAIADMVRANPERLAPWLSDPRWFVVRNVVHILGWIGGDAVIGLLETAQRNSDPRVRQEVVNALASVDPRLARPILVRMLEGSDTKMFCALLHQLSSARDASTARLLVGYLQAEAFEERPIEQKRAIYSALAAVGGDEVVPELEAELHQGNWFARNQEVHRQAVARCLGRMDSPLARLVLERGAQSKRPPIRKACEDALQGLASRD
jgi:HEAT repeat protein